MYYGHAKDLILEIILLLPQIRSNYPELNIFISCNDQYSYLFEKDANFIPKSQIKDQKKKLACLRELIYQDKHPLEEFLNESDIKIKPICQHEICRAGKIASLIPQNNFPVKSLTSIQIQKVIDWCEQQGIAVKINEKIENVDCVIGVESEEIIKSASLGMKVFLVPTGLGENILRQMFPKMAILKI